MGSKIGPYIGPYRALYRIQNKALYRALPYIRPYRAPPVVVKSPVQAIFCHGLWGPETTVRLLPAASR